MIVACDSLCVICFLSVVRYLMFVVRFMFFCCSSCVVVRCALRVACCLLVVCVRCMLISDCGLLIVVRCVLFVACCVVLVVRCVLFLVHCLMFLAWRFVFWCLDTGDWRLAFDV